MSDQPVQILVVEDEKEMKRYLAMLLETNGFSVLEAGDVKEAVAMVVSHTPELVLLDLTLPDGEGFEVIEEIRGWSTMPIIVISAREQEAAKVEALDRGADDYLTKPFGSGELLARIRVALRHARQLGTSDEEPAFREGELEVDLARRQVSFQGEEVDLTPIEYKLLVYLIQNAGKVLTHRQILKHVWGPGAVDRPHYVRIYMANLRKKLEVDPAQPVLFLTETGVGYRFRREWEESRA